MIDLPLHEDMHLDNRISPSRTEQGEPAGCRRWVGLAAPVAKADENEALSAGSARGSHRTPVGRGWLGELHGYVSPP